MQELCWQLHKPLYRQEELQLADLGKVRRQRWRTKDTLALTKTTSGVFHNSRTQYQNPYKPARSWTLQLRSHTKTHLKPSKSEAYGDFTCKDSSQSPASIDVVSVSKSGLPKREDGEPVSAGRFFLWDSRALVLTWRRRSLRRRHAWGGGGVESSAQSSRLVLRRFICTNAV